MNLEKELSLAIDAARQAGNYLKNVSGVEVLSNEAKDIKLREDKESEQIILSILSQGGYEIISEENSPGSVLGDKPTWLIDPLDGSLNFSRGIPNCCVSIALWRRRSPILGVVYDINRNDLYHASVEAGSYINRERIMVSNISEKGNAIICTGFPSGTDYSNTEYSLDFVRKIQDYKKVRLFGSAALSLAYVASGKADVYHERGIYLWDVAAGLALVKFAGGDFKMEPLNRNSFEVWASNGRIDI